ncbi:MAG: hypothetical protein LBF86_04570 [Helicobacteraceae bacterium]|nr:hypothetical protein [Helicobacteraceae bacterium]
MQCSSLGLAFALIILLEVKKKIPLVLFLLSVISLTFLILLAGGGNDDDGDKQKSPPIIKRQKSLGGSANDYANSIQQTNGGGYIIAGVDSFADGAVTENQGDSNYWI